MILPILLFKDTATTEIYTLSLHDALPIYADRDGSGSRRAGAGRGGGATPPRSDRHPRGDRFRALADGAADGARAVPSSPRTRDRKSTRLNSSHANISYAVFCLNKKDHTTR